MDRIKRIIVSAAVLDGSRVLLGRKPKGAPPYPDAWLILGGGVDDYARGEKLLQSKSYHDNYFIDELKRELDEEAGIKITDAVNICPKYRPTLREGDAQTIEGIDVRYIFLEYLCNLDPNSQEARPGDDIAELEWVEKADLNKRRLSPPTEELFQELGWL